MRRKRNLLSGLKPIEQIKAERPKANAVEVAPDPKRIAGFWVIDVSEHNEHMRNDMWVELLPRGTTGRGMPMWAVFVSAGPYGDHVQREFRRMDSRFKAINMLIRGYKKAAKAYGIDRVYRYTHDGKKLEKLQP